MRHGVDSYIFPGVFAPILSLDALTDQHGADGTSSFDIPAETPQPDEYIEQAEAFTALEAFVRNLPPRDHEIVRRLIWQGETQTQIAASFGVSKMAISKAFARICKQGRIVLAPHQDLLLN